MASLFTKSSAPLLTRVIGSSGHLVIESSFHRLAYRLKGWVSAPLAVSRAARKRAPRDESFRRLSFTFAIIALSARVAHAAGAVTAEQYLAFREAFPIKGGECGKIRSLFMLACKDDTPLEHYIVQIRCLFPKKPALYASLVNRLFRIATAGGDVSRQAGRLIEAIAHGLDLTPAQYAHIRARHERPQPHQVLGVGKDVSEAALKKRYRELMKSWHPDRYAGVRLSPEAEQLLKLKASEINEAYRRLSKTAA